MDEFENTQNDGFVLLPAASGGGALVRRSQIAGARANGRDGAIVYAKCGPSIYTSATVSQLGRFLDAEPRQAPGDTAAMPEPDNDPLPALLRDCAALGEIALSSPDCRAAWARKRRRFLGAQADAGEAEPEMSSVASASLAELRSAKGE